MLKPDLTKESTILEINLNSDGTPAAQIRGNKLILDGSKEQFQVLYDMLIDQFDFEPEED